MKIHKIFSLIFLFSILKLNASEEDIFKIDDDQCSPTKKPTISELSDKQQSIKICFEDTKSGSPPPQVSLPNVKFFDLICLTFSQRVKYNFTG